jgi:hypothetical protein
MERNSLRNFYIGALVVFIIAFSLLYISKPLSNTLNVVTSNVIKDTYSSISTPKLNLLRINEPDIIEQNIAITLLVLLSLGALITIVPYGIHPSKKLKPRIKEKLRTLSSKDMEFVITTAIIWLLANLVLKEIATIFNFIVSTFIFISLLVFTAFSVRKLGAATIFSLLAALISIPFPTFGFTGIEKVISLLATGLVFEIHFLITNLEFKGYPIDIILCGAIAATVTPLIVAALISINLIRNNLFLFLNWLASYFILGLAASLLAYFIWYNLRVAQVLRKA